MNTMIRCCIVMVVAAMGVPTAAAFCSSTCPTTSTSSLEVLRLGTSGGSCCDGVGGAETIILARRSSDNRVGACVLSGGNWTWRSLYDTSGSVITWTTMAKDASICAGAGNDIIRVQATSSSCNGTSIAAWSYSGYRLEMHGEGGADDMIGGPGSDRVCGGDDNDDISGGAGADDVDGLAGDDICEGGTGDLDTVWGASGRDYVLDVAGLNETHRSESGADHCLYDNDIHPDTNDVIDCGTDSDITGNCLGTPVVINGCETVCSSCWFY